MQKKVEVLYAFVSPKNPNSEEICTFKILMNNEWKFESVGGFIYRVTLSDIHIVITLIYLLSVLFCGLR